jgi:hypothetical protein
VADYDKITLMLQENEDRDVPAPLVATAVSLQQLSSEKPKIRKKHYDRQK